MYLKSFFEKCWLIVDLELVFFVCYMIVVIVWMWLGVVCIEVDELYMDFN